MLIYSDAKNIQNSTTVLYANAENDVAGVKINEKMQNVAKNRVAEILGGGIKTNISEISAKGDKIICYMKNVYLELDTISMRPILLFYECEKDEAVKTEEESRALAVRFALRNAPRKAKINGFTVERLAGNEEVFVYKIVFGAGEVFVCVRGDTGSVVYYDASALFDV